MTTDSNQKYFVSYRKLLSTKLCALLIFALFTLALTADVFRRMLKTQVKLGNVALVLINLIKRFIFVMFKLLPPNVHAVNIHIFSLVYQLQLLLTLTFVPSRYLFGWFLICLFNGEQFIYKTFQHCIALCHSHYCSSDFGISNR